MKENEKKKLSLLYVRYALERTTLIVLILSVIILSVVLILIANPFIDKGMYLMAFKDIHFNYLKQGLFVIGIFNSLIIAMLSQSFSITSISFDSLFISYTKRSRISVAKILAGFFIIGILLIIEGIIYFAIPILMYDKFKATKEMLYIILYLFLSGIIELLLSMLLTTLVKSFIVPLSVAFISVAIKIVVEAIEDAYKVLAIAIPLLSFNNYEIKIDGIAIAPLWIIALAIFYIGAYESKDLKA